MQRRQCVVAGSHSAIVEWEEVRRVLHVQRVKLPPLPPASLRPHLRLNIKASITSSCLPPSDCKHTLSTLQACVRQMFCSLPFVNVLHRSLSLLSPWVLCVYDALVGYVQSRVIQQHPPLCLLENILGPYLLKSHHCHSLSHGMLQHHSHNTICFCSGVVMDIMHIGFAKMMAHTHRVFERMRNSLPATNDAVMDHRLSKATDKKECVCQPSL